MTPKPLTEGEMFDLLRVAYPEKFKGETFECVLGFAQGISGFEDIAELLGRVIMCTIPWPTYFGDMPTHSLGEVKIEGKIAMIDPAVTREVDW